MKGRIDQQYRFLDHEVKKLWDYLPHTSCVKVITVNKYKGCVKFVAPRPFTCWSSISILKTMHL